jgi:hypothetical protein
MARGEMVQNIVLTTSSSTTASSSSSSSILRFILLVLCITLLHKISRKWEERERFYDDSDESLRGHTMRMRKEVLERCGSDLGNDDLQRTKLKDPHDDDCGVQDWERVKGKARVDECTNEVGYEEKIFAISSGFSKAEKGKGKAMESSSSRKRPVSLNLEQGSLENAGNRTWRASTVELGMVEQRLKDFVEQEGRLKDLQEGAVACGSDSEDPEHTPVQRKRHLEFEEGIVPLEKSGSQLELERWERIQLQSVSFLAYLEAS